METTPNKTYKNEKFIRKFLTDNISRFELDSDETVISMGGELYGDYNCEVLHCGECVFFVEEKIVKKEHIGGCILAEISNTSRYRENPRVAAMKHALASEFKRILHEHSNHLIITII